MADNMHNRCVDGTLKSSKYKGVSWDKGTKKWRAGIRLNSKTLYLGIFNEEDDAARAYDSAAIKKNTTFCRLNFPVTFR
jgi:hypothetical protein